VRGYRIPKASRKLDVVIVAARYAQSGKKLAIGQAYVRRGLVWSDMKLLDRNDLIQRLEDKQRVVTGKPAKIPGEFVVSDHLRLERDNGTVTLRAGTAETKGDDLGLPLF